MLIPVVAALIALVAALAGYTMVKFFGVIFLGQPRENKPRPGPATPAPWERAGMVWLALGCVALGLLPIQFIQLIDPVTRQLVATAWAPRSPPTAGCWRRSTVDRASYGPVALPARAGGELRAGVRLSCAGSTTGALRRGRAVGLRLPVADRARCRTRPRASASRSARSSSRSFACSASCRSPLRRASRATAVVVERPLLALALPCRSPISSNGCRAGSARLQQGRIAVYLLYSFLTLVGTCLHAA